MKYCALVLSSLILSSAFVGATSAQADVRDFFSSTTLNAAWSFVDPLGNGSYSLTASPGNLRLSVPAGGSDHDCWTGISTCTRMMRTMPNDDGTYTIVVDGQPPTAAYQTEGLMLYQDASNYLRFEFWSGGAGTLVCAYKVIGGTGSQVFCTSAAVTMGTSTTTLRVKKNGTQYRLYYRADSNAFTLATTFTQALTVTQAGLYNNTANGQGLNADFSSFAFTAATDPNHINWTPQGTQVPISPSGFPANLSTVGSGNTAVLAAGTYPGFTVPSGVAIYSPTKDAAVVTGNISCGNHNNCTVVGLTVNNAYIDISNTSGAYIYRNTFNNGASTSDIFGNRGIHSENSSNATISHNAFTGMAGTTIVAWNMDSSTITYNTFTNLNQGIDCLFSAAGHGGNTYSYNYFTGLSRMAIECGTGGASGYTAFSNQTVTGNYAENFSWPSTGDTSGNVAYSIVGGDGGVNSTITNNTALGNSTISIGIELNQSGLVSGNRVANTYYGTIVYGASGFDVENNNFTSTSVQVLNYNNGSGTITNNSTSASPAKPTTGPLAP